MILIGFGKNVKGYRLCDPTKRMVITSRDVVINEKEKIIKKLDIQISETDHGFIDAASNEKSQSFESPEQIDDEQTKLSNDSEFVDAYDESEAIRKSERPRISKKCPDYVTYMCIEDMESEFDLEKVLLTV